MFANNSPNIENCYVLMFIKLLIIISIYVSEVICKIILKNKLYFKNL